jgi:putative SOS response-associated peptidase YedK
MCGRYVLINGKMVLQSFLNLHMGNVREVFADLPRYNAAPMQRMPIIAQREKQLVLQNMRWWLVPHWSKDGKIQATTFNAKAETLSQSKLFTPYFKSSRCLVPAEAFYEWKRITTVREVKGKQKEVEVKQPMCIRMTDQQLFMFAGVFSVWKNDKGEEYPSFAIITTKPNDLMAKIHTRMPVILSPKDYAQWLDRDYKEVEKLQKLLVPHPASMMEAFEVSTYVNNTRNEGPECIEELK